MNYRALTTVLLAFPGPVIADDMAFRFTLPGLGGSPGMTSYYLNQLETQKLDFTEEDEQSALESFEEQLERRILSAIASQIVGSIYGGELIGDQVFEVGDLIINYSDVPDENGNICVTIVDGVSSSSVCVPAQ